MGLFGALFAGVSGLDSQSNAIGIISNNIANVNTTGFKQGAAGFDTLVVPSGTTAFSPGGVIGNNQQLVNDQGLIQATTSPTDVAISGNGFFVVNTEADGSGTTLYTRAGDFTQDATGNFVNSDGYYLQGIPVGDSINSVDLKTVSVNQSATGSATATSFLTLAANFNSAESVLLGGGELATLAGDSTNADNNAADIIIPTTDNQLTRGQALQILSTNGTQTTTDTFTYGGFTVGRNITSSTSVGDGGNSLTTEAVDDGMQTYGAGATATATVSAITGINIPSASSHAATTTGATAVGLFASGGTLTVGGVAAITIGANESLSTIASDLQTELQARVGDSAAPGGPSTVTVTGSPNNYSLTVYDALHTGTGFTGTALSGTQSFNVVGPNGIGTSTQVTVTIPSGDIDSYVTGGDITLSGASAIGGIAADDINGTHTIAGVNYTTDTVTFAASNSGTSTSIASGGGGDATVTNRTYVYATGGNILDASSASADFLGTTTTTPFASDALHFGISVNGTTYTFNYNSQPNAAVGQFNSLNSLATAINDSSNSQLTASVSGGQIYISATNPDQAVTFANGDATGNGTLAGINWLQELDLPSVEVPYANAGNGTAGGLAENSVMFNSLGSLASQINTTDPTNLLATVNDATGISTININEASPLQTVAFQDAATNTASVFKALGFVGVDGNQPVTPTGGTAGVDFGSGTFGVTYNPASSSTDMSSGAVTPDFTKDITIYDAQGNSHTVALNTVKIGVNKWAVELTAVPASDLAAPITGLNKTDGQIASCVVTFTGTGALESIQSAGGAVSILSGTTIPVAWANGAATSEIQLSLGTLGESNGLSQTSGAFNVSIAQQNGTPTGELTGVTINASGQVVASFSNGQTQALYQIPLAAISNPDGLQSVSGNAYQQTITSGVPNLVDPGQGGTGSISSSALEESNVDLSTQLTNLIVAQQAYGANSKVLTVADSLLQELDQIIQ